MPDFNSAIDRFKLFLGDQGFSTTVHWIFREDITWHDGKFFIKRPLPAENELVVRSLYERGCVKGLGVSLDVFCLIESQPFCYIWLPEDARQAELALVSGLKLSAPTKAMVAQHVSSWLLWRLHKWLGKRSSAERWLDSLPQRNAENH